jgi:AcrR family transcriptional regulator
MGDVVEEVAKRRGRPPATDSAETWYTILRCSRELFAHRGYSAVTNKELATAAGITTGALYHYVESKLDLYVAVHRDVQGHLYQRFEEAMAQAADTFIAKFEAILEASHVLNLEDLTYTLFTGTVRIDMRRSPELAERLARSVARTDHYFLAMIDIGIASGEINPSDRALVAEFMRIVLTALTDAGSTSAEPHRRSIDALDALLHGRLIRPVPGN